MDENQSDAKDFLRKRFTEDRLIHSNSEEPDEAEIEASSVFRSYTDPSEPIENDSLLAFNKETIVNSEISESDNDTEFSSDKDSLTDADQSLEDPDILDADAESANSNSADISGEENADSSFPLFLSFKANDSIENVSDGVREKNVIRGGNPANQVKEEYVPSMLSSNFPAEEPAGSVNASEIDSFELDTPVFKPVNQVQEDGTSPIGDSLPVSAEKPQEQPIGWEFATSEEMTYSLAQQKKDADLKQPPTIENTNPNPQNPIREIPISHRPAHTTHAPRSVEASNQRASSSKEEMTSQETSALASVLTATARPGTRYTAAQQMGKVAPPLPQNFTKTKKPERQNHKPLLIFLLIVACLILAFSAWYFLDLSDVFFGTGKEASNTTAIAAATTRETTHKTTATPTAKPTAAPTTTPTAKPTATPTAKPTATPTAKPTATPTAKPTATPTAKPTATPTAKPTNTPSPTPAAVSAQIPSGFSTKITDGHASADTASFIIQFTNSGGNDVSLLDGVESITIIYNSSVTIIEVTSDDFVFTAKENSNNTFIGTPVSTDVIAYKDTRPVTIYAKSDGAVIGNYSIKYSIQCYES